MFSIKLSVTHFKMDFPGSSSIIRYCESDDKTPNGRDPVVTIDSTDERFAQTRTISQSFQKTSIPGAAKIQGTLHVTLFSSTGW